MQEIWKNLPDFEELYEISNLGNVRTKERIYRSFNGHKMCNMKIKQKTMKTQLTKGYKTVGLWKNGKMYNKTVHRLVAKAFIPNPNNYPVVNHIDGDKTNSCANNLEWCTYGQNTIHAYKTGLTKVGKKHMENIRNLGLKSGKKVIQKDLNGNIINIFRSTLQAAKQNGYTQSQISLCCNNKIKNYKGFIWEFLEGSDVYEFCKQQKSW